MKKTFSYITALVLVASLSLAACTGPAEDTKGAEEQEATEGQAGGGEEHPSSSQEHPSADEEASEHPTSDDTASDTTASEHPEHPTN